MATMVLNKISGLLGLPKLATAPFCPSEVQGSVSVSASAPSWKKFLRFLGPGLLVSVGYMDPGNWATDIAAGSKFGYGLLCVVVFSSLLAILLQYLSLKLGVATGHDLSQHIRAHYSREANFTLWVLGELAIIACDVAEVLGSALAFKLLFGCSMVTGILITALDTMIILGLRGKGFRQIEAIILGLVSTVGLSFLAQLIFAKPQASQILSGFFPTADTLMSREGWYLAIGILGATVMPHNLYLHSSIVQTRRTDESEIKKSEAIRYSALDSSFSLLLALLVNAAILILAAHVFHFNGHNEVADIADAHSLLSPLVGTSAAGILFAVALLASGQSSTFTGTIAGQVLMEGHMKWKIPCWQRRLITRALALLPALAGVWWLGENSVGKLLVFSQVVLSLQLPFALFPLIQFVSKKTIMGHFAISKTTQSFAWTAFALIVSANLWLVGQALWP
jgi:manganese transport protein